jgi:sulfur relay (sulfurtransferase) complex TusBCD TusD component (DsrE family)
MFPRSWFARYALVAAASALVALALAAPAANANNNGFNERILNCIETRDANSDQCLAALEVSPVDSNFFRVLADNLDNMPAKEETQPEVDLYTLVKECAATQDLESEACVVALERSGLTLDEFKAKFATKLGKVAKKDEMTALMKTCLELKASLNGKTAYQLHDLIEKVNYVCGKALAESHLSAAQFWNKYR